MTVSAYVRVDLGTSGGSGGGTSSLAASTHGPTRTAATFPSSAPAFAFSCACDRGRNDISSWYTSGAATLTLADESTSVASPLFFFGHCFLQGYTFCTETMHVEIY